MQYSCITFITPKQIKLIKNVNVTYELLYHILPLPNRTIVSSHLHDSGNKLNVRPPA